ncbi:MAG: flagellar basal body-associated FliL family protein [Hyphomicrobiaceae bacterium]
MSIVRTALAFLAVTFVGAGAGLGSAWFHAKTSPTGAHVDQRACETGASEKFQLSDAASVVLEIPSIITNLRGENAPWVRLEVSVILPVGFSDKGRYGAQLAQDFLGYMRTLEAAQLVGGTNLQFLKEDLKEIASIRTEQPGTDVLIRTLVIE